MVMRVRIAPAALLDVEACSRQPAPTTAPTPAPPTVFPPDPVDSSIPPPRLKPETPRGGDTNQPQPYARFTFDDDEDENLGAGKATLLRRNAPVRDGAMYLNGIY